MNFCSQCGDKVRFAVPEGDDRPRYLCDACGTIHYQNPRIVAGTLPVSGSKVLLCKRAISPRKGYWTLPAGYMENAESTSRQLPERPVKRPVPRSNWPTSTP